MASTKPLSGAAPPRFDSIQALRAFAAVYVYLFHSKVLLPLWSEEATKKLEMILSRGFMGVDIFFVVSGFIMAWVCVLSRAAPETPGAFLVKRFFRIGPPQFLATVIASYLLISKSASEGFWRTAFFYPYSDTDPAPYFGLPINPVSWTLNYEAFFYVLFGLALFAGRRALPAVLTLLLACVFLVPLAGGSPLTLDPYAKSALGHVYARMATNPLVLEFGLGILSAFAFFHLRGRLPRFVVWCLLVSSVAILIWRMTAVEPNFGGHSLVKLGLPAAFLLLAVALADDANLFAVPRVLVWIGEISFALYLLHPMVIEQLSQGNRPPPMGDPGNWGKVAFNLLILLIVAHYWQRWIETPSAVAGGNLARRLTSARRSVRDQGIDPPSPAAALKVRTSLRER